MASAQCSSIFTFQKSLHSSESKQVLCFSCYCPELILNDFEMGSSSHTIFATMIMGLLAASASKEVEICERLDKEVGADSLGYSI